MKCLQILFRVPFSDCSGIVSWMSGVSYRITVGQHDKDDDIKTTHCHIAIEPKVSNEAIRKQIVKANLAGDKYSIMEKVLKTHELYEYRDLVKYIIKGDPLHIKYTTEHNDVILELSKEWINRAKKLDVDLTNTDSVSGHTGITGSNVVVEKENDNVFDKLLKKFEKRVNNTDMTMYQIKKWIKSEYLTKRKCIPREGDTNRYAYSLWSIVNNKQEYDDIDSCERQKEISQC